MSQNQELQNHENGEAEESRIVKLESLRAKIWKLALMAEDEKTLVQSLLDNAGPVLGCENISFMPYDKNLKEIVVELQWRADGKEIGLGESIPKWVLNRYVGWPHIQISFDNIPLWLQPVLKIFQRKYGTRSTLIIPYGDPHQPEGYIAVNNYSYSKTYSPDEIELFIELSKIIHLRSKQLQSQAALQASEARFRQMFETNQAIKLIIDPATGRIVEANQAALRFYGYDYPTFTQMRVTAINTLPEAELQQEMERARRGECPLFYFRHRLASGEIRDVEVYSGPVKTAQGELLYSIIHDVSERKQAERVLRRSEEKMRSLSRLAQQLEQARSHAEIVEPLQEEIQVILGYQVVRIYLIDEDMSHAWLLAGAGETAEALIERPLVFKIKDDDYLEEVLEADHVVVIEDAQIDPRTNKEFVARYGNRTIIVAPILLKHRKLGAIFTGTFGAEGVKVPTPTELDYLEAVARHVAVVVDRIQFLFEREKSAKALQDSNQQLQTALTELKETQEQMVQQERLAAVGQLAAGVAHDFNNILTGILGFAELLRTSPDIPPAAQEDLGRIVDSSQRAAQLVRQLLDFSRKSIRRPHQLDLVPFLDQAVKFLRRTIPESIQLHLDIKPGAYLLEADSTQLQQLLTNLAINARDAMPDRGELWLVLSRIRAAGEARCALCQHSIAGDWLRLQVRDTGCGIQPEMLPRIFEPFFTTKTVGEGSGLGLAQVAGIVMQHGGHLMVESRDGQGSVFSVYLPPAKQNITSASLAEPSSLTYGDGETILLIEDDLPVQKVCEAMLESLNYRVLTAANGEAALAVYDQYKDEISLVLSDMVMPDMDGAALYDALLPQSPELKMVIMSGYPLSEQGGQLLEQNTVAWIQKPMSIMQLSQVISKALENEENAEIVPASVENG